MSTSQDKYRSNVTNKGFHGLTWIGYMSKVLKLDEAVNWVRQVICTETRSVAWLFEQYLFE